MRGRWLCWMDHNHWLGVNADHLEQALVRPRALAEQIADAELRSRRLDAIASLHNYTELLREAASADASVSSPLRGSRQPTTFAFKLELQDGRWHVDEKVLETPPRVGDVLSFGGHRWRVRASEIVKTRPARRPARGLRLRTRSQCNGGRRRRSNHAGLGYGVYRLRS